MFCSKCGAEIPVGAQFCPRCGTPVNVAPAPQKPTPQPVYQQAPQPVRRPQIPGLLVGFILSVAGLSLCWIPIIGLGLPIAGLIICNKASRYAEEHPDNYANRGFLKPGRICGIIGIIAGSIFAVYWFVMFIFALSLY